MRSLTVLSEERYDVKGKKTEARFVAIAVRPEQTLGTRNDETLYVAAERQLPDGGVEVQIFVANDDTASSSSASAPLIASFRAPPEPPFAASGHVVTFAYLAESNTLSVILAGGDIVTVRLEDVLAPGEERVDVVGSVEAGIKAGAWSPDQELLVLVTGEDNIVEMTKTFDILTEQALATSAFGEEHPVDVGWGAQATQFHGSLGKSGRDALIRHDQISLSIETAPTEGSASYSLRAISWRGDGAYFVVSSFMHGSRRLRFYSREGVLQSTSESSSSFEDAVAWQPSGSIIAVPSNIGDKILFFERNGLRRYEFALDSIPNGVKRTVKQLSWNCDSTLLAVWFDQCLPDSHQSVQQLQLWRRNNYHWYLKQTFSSSLNELEKFEWHPEDPFVFFTIQSSCCNRLSMQSVVFASSRPFPYDTGAVAIIDGPRILFTPFRYENIPPPMASLTISIQSGLSPRHLAFSNDADLLAALLPNNSVSLWSWSNPRGNAVSSRLIGTFSLDLQRSAWQIALSGRNDDGSLLLHILVSPDKEGASSISTYSLDNSSSRLICNAKVTTADLVQSLSVLDGRVCVQTSLGNLLLFRESKLSEVGAFPRFCSEWNALGPSTFVGLSSSGQLYHNSHCLVSDCTSFRFTGVYLIYTTLQHNVHFLPLSKLKSISEDPMNDMITHSLSYGVPKDLPASDSAYTAGNFTRHLERGARLVQAVPSSMSLVLQMPRGNLETIFPRPLAIQRIGSFLEHKQYHDAFLVCRRHRIDLNILHDHNPAAFRQDVPVFVDQIARTDYLNLFISGMKDVDVTQALFGKLYPDATSERRYFMNKKNMICLAIREAMLVKDLAQYAQSIITTYVCQDPANLEEALKTISKVKVLSQVSANEALKYMTLLVDSDRLYDEALGMYDFELVLAVAQNTHKDPREYIPFLRELRAYEKHYQRFRIDDHLRRHSRAMKNLYAAGQKHFDEFLSYIKSHELFDEAVKATALSRDDRPVVLDRRGDWLMTDSRYSEAALSYSLAGQPRKAMVAHQKAGSWKELFYIAKQQALAGAEAKQLAINVAQTLKSRGNFLDAAEVLRDYADDVLGSVVVLCEGDLFEEALRQAMLHDEMSSIPRIIIPHLLDTRKRILEDVGQIADQVAKQTERLEVLREKRVSDSAGFFGKFMLQDGDADLDNVDVQTDAASTVAASQFTRYTRAVSTKAGSAKSGKTQRSSRSGKKAALKAMSGAKGSVFEESYLLGSLTRLVVENGRLPNLALLASTINYLCVRLASEAETLQTAATSSAEILELAAELEDRIANLLSSVEDSVDATWSALGDVQLHDVELAVLTEHTGELSESQILRRPSKPLMAALGHWKVPVLSLLRTNIEV